MCANGEKLTHYRLIRKSNERKVTVMTQDSLGLIRQVRLTNGHELRFKIALRVVETHSAFLNAVSCLSYFTKDIK